MSIARGFSPLDIMTLGDFRGANEAGDGLVVLAPALDSVLWANEAGRVLLGLTDERPSLSPMSGLSRQIRATARLIETRGEARLLLRPATGLAAQPVVADLKRVETQEGFEVVVLAAAAPRPAAPTLAALADRLLTESGLDDAAIYGRDGTLVSSAAAPAVEGLSSEIAALLDSGQPQRIVDRADARLTLARVASDLVLVRQDRPSAHAHTEAAGPAESLAGEETASGSADSAAAQSDPAAEVRPAESAEATSMSAIVRRWHSRGMPTGLAPAWRPADTPAPLDTTPTRSDEDMVLPGDAVSDDEAAKGPTVASEADTAIAGMGAAEPADVERAATERADTEFGDAERVDTGPTAPGPWHVPPTAELEADRSEPLALNNQAAPAEPAPPRQRSVWGAPVAAPLALSPGHPDASTSADTADVAPGDDSLRTETGVLPVAAEPEAPPASQGDLPHKTASQDGPPPPVRPLRSVWGVAAEPAAPSLPAVLGDEDSPQPGRVAPTPDPLGGRDDLVPNDAPDWGDGESAPSVEKPAPAFVPETAPDMPAEYDDPIDEDAETPGEEDLCPGGEERSRPEGRLPPAIAAETAPGADTPAAGDPDADGAQETPPLKGEAAGAAMAEAPAMTPVAMPEPFAPSFSGAPVRFVWQIDRNGKFRSLTPEFSAAVGPRAADVAGRSFREVADVFGFDTSGEISRLLERRDTWSGRSILWPVEASSRKVPVDLAALPVYARDRSFDGFRGFGIVRMNESVPDPDGIGMILADVTAFEPDISDLPEAVAPAAIAEAEGTPPSPASDLGDAPAGPDRPLLTTFAAPTPPSAFGRRPEPPLPAASSPEDERTDDSEPKVIRLEERRRPRDASLSLAEEAAFRAIGVTLGRDRAKAPREERGGSSQGQARSSETDEVTEADVSLDAASPAASPAATQEPREDAPAPAVGEDRALIGDAETENPSQPAAAERIVLPAPTQQDDLLPKPVDGTSGDDDNPALAVPPASFGSNGPDAAPSDAPASEAADTERTEAELAEEAALLPAAMTAEIEAIFATLPLPILVQMNETLIYANREFQDLSGYADLKALEAAGGLGALFTEPTDALSPGELAIRRSNGQIADVRVHMQRATFAGRSCLMMSFSPSPREIAAVAGVSPERAEPAAETAEADLRQQVEELQAVLDTATDGIVLLDTAGIIRAMNGSAHALFGLGPDESTGRHLSSLFAPESQQATLDYLEMLREEGLAGILNDGREVIGQVAQGGPIPLFITIGRLTGERGWCVVIRDIAHWKRIEEDLVNARRQAEAASLHKSRFLANISHELRTPLNAIIGFADVMASECFGPIGNERYIEYLGDIKRSGHHVLDLVNDLLDISKIEAGKLDLAFEAVSLNEVIAEVVSLMQPQANRERVIVRSNLPSSVPPVVADRRTMRQIALNLIANAIRFTPAGGQIIASTTYTADGEVLLRFRDSGIGMSEREIDIALTPFQQVHPPGATRGEGTGLGLPLTKAMVEANRANFAISSAPGEGTLVEIAFPSQRVLAD